MPSLTDFLQRRTGGSIFALYNGYGLTDDSLLDVQEYYLDHGLDYDFLDRITFIEKEYGYFRPWMDNGASDHVILATIRQMVMHRVNDSRQLDLSTVLSESDLEELESAGFDYTEDPLFLPDFMTLSKLRSMSPFLLAGGGRNECLREIELLANAFNIRYRRMERFIYG
jgi:hypothetical protein